MATYTVSFYDFDPWGVIPTSGTFTYTGPASATGTATIYDTETGIEGLTLDDDSAGAAVTDEANISVNQDE